MILPQFRGVAPTNFVTTGFNPLKGESENMENVGSAHIVMSRCTGMIWVVPMALFCRRRT
jgi:hypothetical protein